MFRLLFIRLKKYFFLKQYKSRREETYCEWSDMLQDLSLCSIYILFKKQPRNSAFKIKFFIKHTYSYREIHKHTRERRRRERRAGKVTENRKEAIDNFSLKRSNEFYFCQWSMFAPHLSLYIIINISFFLIINRLFFMSHKKKIYSFL